MTFSDPLKIFVFFVVIQFVNSVCVPPPPKRNWTKEWEHFKNKCNSTECEKIFNENARLIDDHNSKTNPCPKFYLDMNQFINLNRVQFKEEYLESIYMPEPDKRVRLTHELKTEDDSFTLDDSETLDLRYVKEAFVSSKIKEQNSSHYPKQSWAFSAVGALEGQIFENCIERKMENQSLSEGFLIECGSPTFKARDSWDWYLQQAFDFVKDNDVFTDEVYSYAKNQKINCSRMKKMLKSIPIREVTQEQLNKNTIRSKLLQNKPVPAYVDASHPSFQFYREGIYEEPACNIDCTPNHAVLIIGFGKDYWLVKNSWGENWGDKGYMKIAHETCGIEWNALVPIVTKDSSDQCK